MADNENLTDAEWRKKLTPEQYRICREKGTERPFTGEYWQEFNAGDYRCRVFMLRSIKQLFVKTWIPAITWCVPRWCAANAIVISVMCLPTDPRQPAYATASTLRQFSSRLMKNNATAAVVGSQLPFYFFCTIAPKGLIL